VRETPSFSASWHFLQRVAGADGAVAQMGAQGLIDLVAEGKRTLERLDGGYHG
jgi:hypothetical protein